MGASPCSMVAMVSVAISTKRWQCPLSNKKLLSIKVRPAPLSSAREIMLTGLLDFSHFFKT